MDTKNINWKNDKIIWPDFKWAETLFVTPEMRGKIEVDGNWFYYNGVHYAKLVSAYDYDYSI